MARIITILDEAQRQEFDRPPRFNYQQRKFFFMLPGWANDFRRQLQTPHSELGFILQVGYFKAAGRFFNPKHFAEADAEYIRKRWQLDTSELSRYDWATIGRHRNMILINFGVKPFDQVQRANLLVQSTLYARRQMNPVAVFRSTADYVRSHCIEVPTYALLASVITSAFRFIEAQTSDQLRQFLTPAMQQRLDTLGDWDEDKMLPKDNVSSADPAANVWRYRLTRLKRTQETMRPSVIRHTVQDYGWLKQTYSLLQPVLVGLGLTDEMIQYYAGFVLRARHHQLFTAAETTVDARLYRRYLMLICFVVYQYYSLGDLLTETLLSAIQTHTNAVKREEKERVFLHHQATEQDLVDVLDGVLTHADWLKVLEEVAFSFAKTHQEKVTDLVEWLRSAKTKEFQTLKPKVERLQKGHRLGTVHYQIIEERSRSLQSRFADILRQVTYQSAPDDALGIALEQFRQRDGQLSSPLATDFLRPGERSALEEATSKVSLYKVLLAQHVAEALRSGRLNLPHSFQYRPFDEYLIGMDTWRADKTGLLEQANLTPIADCTTVLAAIKLELEKGFNRTFGRLDEGTNPYVLRRRNGQPRFTEMKLDAAPVADIDLFPQDRFVPVYEVLHTVNQHCHFTDCLEHFQHRHSRGRPTEGTLFAGLLAYGCNIGVTKMAYTAKNLTLSRLENAINWYFSIDNLRQANDTIVALIGKLPLGRLFRRLPDSLHTSSDGQKYYIAVDSIHANYSYKYFGQEKGIVVYSFMDELHRLFFSTTFSAQEREAGYVLDGLLHNDVVQSDSHSTDTHGYTEVIFALTHLLGIQFAPRIKEFQDKKLYPMPEMTVPTLQNYVLKIGQPVNTKLIAQHWDQMARLVASLKLKHVTASSILRRLNSYSQKHPLYQALREFGRLIRTRFLLSYMDDDDLRKRIDLQLNKLENAHQFARAVFYANSGEIQYASKEEHQRTDACKRLVQNAIICWNYLYLTKQVVGTVEPGRGVLVDLISRSSPVSWQHVNMQGEFDFSEESLRDSIEFNLDELIGASM
jgi:TnpA family transposase